MPHTISRKNAGPRPSRLTLLAWLLGLTLVAVCLPGLPPPAAHAATTFTVNSTGDGADSNTADGVCNDGAGNCTLRAAIQQANATDGADTINFSVTGTINLTGELPWISTSMAINGPGPSLLTVRRDSGGEYRIFSVLPSPSTPVSISGLTVTNGKMTSDVGRPASPAILNSGTLTLTEVVVTGNIGVKFFYMAFAGVINNTGTLIIDRGTISGNEGFENGGILNSGTLVMTNSTVSGNRGNSAIFNYGRLSLTNCTVADNYSPEGPAYSRGITSFGEYQDATLSNTIVARNGADVQGLFTSRGHNLIGNSEGTAEGGRGFSASLADQVGTDAAPIDPRLAPLADNGGPTPTHALLDDSPAINRGGNHLAVEANNNPLTTDQRWAGRYAGPMSIVDIGAFEVNPGMEEVSDKAAFEDAPLSFYFTAGDGSNVSSVTASSNNQALLPDANLTVTGSGGVRNLRVAPAPDQHGSAHVTLTTNYSNNQPISSTFRVTVTPINDAPSFTKGADQAVAEDAGPQTVSGWASAVSPGPGEAGQPLSFAVTANTNPALFSAGPAVSSSGTLTYTPAPNANGSAAVTLVLKDTGGTANGGQDTSSAQTFTITVTPVNDPPTVSGQSVTTSEDTAKAVTLAGSDVDGDPLTFQVVSGPANGALSGSGASRTYTPSADYSGADSFTFKAVDSARAESAPATVSINVTPVNDAPTFVNGGDRFVAEDAGPQAMTGWASVISPGPGESGQSVSFLVTGNTNPSLFSSAPAVSPSGTLTFTPARDAYGSATITLVAKDDGGIANGGKDTSAPLAFKITVTPVNDPPAANSQAVTTSEDTPKVITLAGSDIDGDPLTFTIVSAPSHGALSGSGASRTYTPASDFHGSDSFTFKAVDPGGAESAPASVSVTVTPVNDAPSFAKGSDQAVAEDAGPQTVSGWATAVGPGPGEAGQSVTFLVTGNTNPSIFSSLPAVSRTGTLTFTPAPNANGSASVTLVLKDDGGTAGGGRDTSAPQTFTVTVTPVNDAPVASDLTIAATEDAPRLITFAGSDVDGDPLTFQVVSDPAHGTLAGSGSGRTYTPAADYSGPDSFTFKAVDSAGAESQPATVSITVTAVNDPPVNTVPGPQATDQDTTLVFSAANSNAVSVADVDAGADPVRVTLTAANGTLTLGGTNGLTFSAGDGTDDAAMTFAGAVPAVNAALAGLAFKPAAAFSGAASLQVTTNDQGASGSGGAGGDTDTVSITVRAGTIEFTHSAYTAAEGAGSLAVTVRRTGGTSQEASVDYATDDGSIPSVSVPCSATAGAALDRCDFTRALGRLTFAPGESEKSFVVLVSDDSYVEGPETALLRLSNPGGGPTLGSRVTATLEITDDALEGAPNPIDESARFVRQHYHDFLNREPDEAGLAFWTNDIEVCGTDLRCREVKRINVSAAFFLSIEFQQTGYFVYRLDKVAFGNLAGKPVPLTLAEFLSDTQGIGRGVVVGADGWEQTLENSKRTFADAFAARTRFRNRYPAGMTPELYVDSLNANAGGVLSQAERDSLVAGLRGGGKTRTDVLRDVAEHPSVARRESNQAFVLMQYYGYLRRDPDAAPDSDFAGYGFWLAKLNEFNGNYIAAEMVKAFISSDEYRKRFGL